MALGGMKGGRRCTGKLTIIIISGTQPHPGWNTSPGYKKE